MGGIAGINAFRQAANMPVNNYEQSQQPNAPRIKLVDGGAEGNIQLRRQLLQSIGSTYRVSDAFLDQVQERLGLVGDFEIARKPLEARVVRELIDEAEVQANVRLARTSAAVVNAADSLLDDAFAKGVDITFCEVLTSLSEIVPGDQLGEAAKMALNVYTERMRAHMEEVKAAALKNWQTQPEEHTAAQMNAFLNELREYGQRAVKMMRQAATKNDFDFDVEFTNRMLSMVWSVGTFAAQVGTFANIAKTQATVSVAIKEARAAEARVTAEEVKQRMREMIDDLQGRMQELQQMLQRLARLLDRADAEQDKADEESATSIIATSVERRCQEISEAVAGFERRIQADWLMPEAAPKSTFDFNAKGI